MTPNIWRKANGEPMGPVSQYLLRAAAREAMDAGRRYEEWALKWGCCPEQARLFLPLLAAPEPEKRGWYD